jgi:hypothetical protein
MYCFSDIYKDKTEALNTQVLKLLKIISFCKKFRNCLNC